MLRRIFIFILLSATMSLAQAQVSKEARKYLEDASGYFQVGDYVSALQYYLKASELSPKDPGIAYSVAMCYHMTNQGYAALPYLELAQSAGMVDEMFPYYMGVSLHLHHRFDDALVYLHRFQTQRGMDKYYITQTERVIQWCHTGKHLIAKPEKVKITNVGPSINSKFPDYNPVVSVDETEILFTSRRTGSTGGELFPGDQLFYEDIYTASKGNDQWSAATNVGTAINTNTHDACVGLSPDGQTLFLYKTLENQEYGDLYVSYLKGKEWSAPQALTAVNSTAWEPCATMSADGKTLVFVSNRKGGPGGTDLYISKRLPNGNFGAPVLLSSSLNTSHNEFSPYLHPDGTTLYYSSDGPHSMGGYDIFSCKLNLETNELISDPVNLGYPINTADDEAFFVWSADGKRAYFSSVREGGMGDKDIYVLEREEVKQEIALVVLKGNVVDCKSSQPIEAEISVVDNHTGTTVGQYYSNASTGKYIVVLPAGRNYGISVNAKSYAFHSKNIDIPHLKHYEEIEDQVCLNSIKVGTTFVLNNIFFDVNQATLRPESKAELERVYEILSQNPTIKVELSGHTDSDGEEAHNLQLSENRALAVRDYLVSRGIDVSRMTYKGYGESKPIATNDTPEHKQLNRRTEMVITE